MLRTSVDLTSYKFIYTYDKFTVYSNTESSALALETTPIYTNDYNDPRNLEYKAELYFLSNKNILYDNASELLHVAEKIKLSESQIFLNLIITILFKRA